MPTSVRRLTPGDIPAIRDLRLSVGWQAHDWALLDAMREPHAAFFGIDEDGRLTAIGSAIAYGPLGIVGNMVVAADRRRQGLGSRILGEALAFLEARGTRRIELFATPDGRQLYGRFGFTSLAVGIMIEIARDLAIGAGVAGIVVRAGEPADLTAIAAYDLPRYGADRSPILRSALNDPGRPTLVAIRAGAVAGFAVLRPAGMRLGPWVADDVDIAGALLAAAAGAVPAGTTLSAHLPGENERGRAWLTGLGGTGTPMDGRMARGSALDRRLDTIYGNTMGALG